MHVELADSTDFRKFIYLTDLLDKDLQEAEAKAKMNNQRR